MLHQNISKYGLATHLALAAALPAALAQFISSDAFAATILWVSFAAGVWILMEPSVLAGETISEARRRVVSRMFRDPLTWFLLVVVVFAFARWLNSGVALAYNAETTVWSVKEPAVEVLPASVGSAGFLPFALSVSFATVILGIKHSLGRNARVWFGIATGVVSATGAFAAVVCAGMGIEPFKSTALATIGASSFPGSLYALFLPAAIACGIEAEGRGMTKARLLFAWAVAGNAVGAFVFLPGLLSLLYFGLSVFVAIVSLVLLKINSGIASTARAASMLFFGIAIAAFSAMLPSYAEIQDSKLNGMDVEKVFTPALADRDEALRRISKAMWVEHPWSGVGIGAFKLQAPFFAGRDDWTVLPPTPTDGSNGYFTLLAERGIFGVILWLVAIGWLLQFWFARFIGSFAWQRAQDEGRSWFLAMPSIVWVGPIVMLAFFADAWFSSGFPLTPLAACLISAMPLAAASFPKVKQKKDNGAKEG